MSKETVVTPVTPVKVTEKVELADIPKEKIDQHEDPRMAIAKKHDEARDKQVKEDNARIRKEIDDQNLEPVVDKPETADKIDGIDSAKIPIVIHGKERMVDKDKVDKAGGIAAYQKEVAVMQGFKDVAEQKKVLDAREREISEREANIGKQELPALDDPKANTKEAVPTDLPSDDQPTVEDLIKQQREAVLDGDDSLADDLMKQLLNVHKPVKQQELNKDSVVSEAASKSAEIVIEQQYQQTVQDAKTDLFKAHPDLKTDARLFQAVDDETVRVQHEFPDYTPTQVLTESYNRVQSWRGKPNKPDSMSTKENEKRALNTPKSSTGRADAPPPTPTKTNADYVTKLKEARGQA